MANYKLCFYVPTTHVEDVKDAVFAAGAGQIGNYEACAWQVLGEGQFRPLKGSAPFLGSENELARVQEYRVEMLCSEPNLRAVVSALHDAHPYEEPAFDVWELCELL